MSNVRYVLDIIDATREDTEWLTRTMKNIVALLNVNNHQHGANAFLCIAPLKEEDKDEYKDQDNK